MEEYEKAKTAAAAGNRANAEAARREAERQAKIAADKAAEAKKVAAAAGSKELKFSGGAYRVGDVSIKPEGGVTKDLIDTVIARTPSTALRVTGSRSSDVYKYICSANNGQSSCSTASTNAIQLFTKYIAPKKTTIYRRRFSTVQITGNVGAVSTENDYGTVAFSGNTYPVDKEDGEFYEVDRYENRPPHPYTGYDDDREAGQLTRADVRSSEVVDNDDRNAEEATGIYSFTPEEDITINRVTFAANQKVYLKRDGTTAGKPDYKIISIFRDVTIPVSTPYEHMNYGLWMNYESDTSGTQADMGIGFVRMLAGKSMTPDMPASGIVTYDGHGILNTRIRNSHPETGIRGDIGVYRTYTTTTADFGRNKISVDFGGPVSTDFATDVVEFQLKGDISGNGFSGTTATVPTGGGFSYDYGTGGAVEGVHSELQPGGSFTGTFKGNFFGPGAAEVGGVFDFTSEDNKDGSFRGAFGGVKSFSTE